MKVTTMAINFHNKLIKIDNEDDRNAIQRVFQVENWSK